MGRRTRKRGSENIFKRHFPIHKIFERSWISEVFGVRLNRRLRGNLATVLDQIEHGHHVFRAYWKNAFLKQYEKFARCLRNELCSNNLCDFGLNWTPCAPASRSLPTALPASRRQCLNVHVDFPLLQRLALPITLGSVRYPGIKIHATRVIRLLEVLLPWRQQAWRLDRKTDPPGRPHHLSALSQTVWAESAPLRSTQTPGARSVATRWHPICLPAHPQRGSGGTPVSVLPQAPLRPFGQQPLSPPSRPSSRTRQQTRGRLSQG